VTDVEQGSGSVVGWRDRLVVAERSLAERESDELNAERQRRVLEGGSDVVWELATNPGSLTREVVAGGSPDRRRDLLRVNDWVLSQGVPLEVSVAWLAALVGARVARLGGGEGSVVVDSVVDECLRVLPVPVCGQVFDRVLVEEDSPVELVEWLRARAQVLDDAQGVGE